MIAIAANSRAGKARGVWALLCAAAVCALALLGICGCAQKETPQATITVVCTDEMRASLADTGVTDAAAFLKAAGDEFAARFTDVDVTVEVIAVESGWSQTAAAVVVAGEGIIAGGEGESAAGENEGAADEGAGEGAGEGASASAALPAADVLFGSYDDLASAVYAGRAVPLDGLIDQTMRASVPASYLAAGVVPANGGTYLLPFSVSPKVLVINPTLFAECGLVLQAPAGEGDGEDGGEGANVDVDADNADGADAESAIVLFASAEEAATDACVRTEVQTWTPAQWVQVLSALADGLPEVAKARLEERTAAWTEATDAAYAAAMVSEAEAENARANSEDEEEAAQIEIFDLDAALEEIGPKPESEPIYAMMMAGSDTAGAECIAVLLQAFGGALFDGEGYALVENRGVIEAISWLEFLSDQGIFPADAAELSSADCLELFRAGRLGMVVVDAADLYALYLDDVEYCEITPEAAETAETADEGETAGEGEAADESTPASAPEPIIGYRIAQDLVCVTFPVLPTGSWELMAQRWLAGDDEEALAALSETEGAAILDASADCLVPATFYGFAVLDNGDELTLSLAREFVGYVLGSDAWRAYEACADQVPAHSSVFSAYASLLPFSASQERLQAHTVNVSSNVISWNRASDALAAEVCKAMVDDRTPVEVTADIDKAMNALFEPAYRSATLHE